MIFLAVFAAAFVATKAYLGIADESDWIVTRPEPLPKRTSLMETIYAIHPSQVEQLFCVNDGSPATHYAQESYEALCCDCADLICEFRDSLTGVELFVVAWRNKGE